VGVRWFGVGEQKRNRTLHLIPFQPPTKKRGCNAIGGGGQTKEHGFMPNQERKRTRKGGSQKEAGGALPAGKGCLRNHSPVNQGEGGGISKKGFLNIMKWSRKIAKILGGGEGGRD